MHLCMCTLMHSVSYGELHSVWTVERIDWCKGLFYVCVSLLCTQLCFCIVLVVNVSVIIITITAFVSVITVDMTIFETTTDSMGKIIIQKTSAVQTFS